MTVRVYRSTDIGAPSSTAAAGCGIGLLDGCLVRGYGLQEVGITRTGATATVTTSIAHGLKNGTWVTISGASDDAYNGDHAITVTTGTTFTYPVLGTPVSPAEFTAAGTSNRTVALLHAESAIDGDTAIIDDVGHQFVALGIAPRISTAASKIGSSSLFFDASGYHVKSSSPDYALGTSSFTFECWVNPVKGNGLAGGVYGRILQIGTDNIAGNFMIVTTGPDNPTKLQVAGYTTTNVYMAPTTTQTIANGSWTHLAVVRIGDIWTFYINGTLVSTQTLAYNITASDLYIGGTSTGVSNFYGYIDEVRLSRGAVYTANFTPAITAFMADTTGAIRMKITPAGWGRPFSGAGTAGYKQGAGSNGFYLRVYNKEAVTAGVTGYMDLYEKLYTIDYGTGYVGRTGIPAMQSYSYPTNGWWVVVATEKIVYMFGESGYRVSFIGVGDIDSYKQGDIYGTILMGCSSLGFTNYSYGWALNPSSLGNLTDHALVRAYTQTGSAIACGKESRHGYSTLGGGGITYPSPMDGGVHLDTVRITEGAAGVRGVLPGIWNILHSYPFNNLDVINGTGPQLGKIFLAIKATNAPGNSQVLVEISNTW